MKRIWIYMPLSVLFIWHTGISSVVYEKPGEISKPNIVFILTDDQGWGDIHYNGNSNLKTPVIDNFAEKAVRFNRFYVSPLCAPTRASFLTGKYHLRTGVTGVSRGMEIMKTEELTIAEVLKKYGYTTGCFGKWHNGKHFPCNANGQGFDVFFGFNGGHLGNFFNPVLERNNEKILTKGYITDILADSAISFIQKNADRPFFCYIPFNAPHSPYQVPDKYFNKYSCLGFDTATATVYGMCENLDENIARILHEINTLGITDKTIIVFSTDNGPNGRYRYNGGMKGWKGQPDEGGVRVPFYIQWENHLKPTDVNNKLAAHIDFLPTILELCNIPVPENVQLDGISMVPILSESNAKWPDRTIFTHIFNNNLVPYTGSLRNNDYCFVNEKDQAFLYNIKHDPGQNQNIAEVFPHFTDSLRVIYENWFSQVSKGVSEDVIVPVGFQEAPFVELPATYAYFTGNIHFKGLGYDNDWLKNWISETDSIWWRINNREKADFELSVYYSCPKNAIGTEVEMVVDHHNMKFRISEPFDPGPYHTLDRAPRGGVYEKPFRQLTVGNFYLPSGIHTITLKPIKIIGEGIEIKSISLTKKNKQ